MYDLGSDGLFGTADDSGEIHIEDIEQERIKEMNRTENASAIILNSR